MSRSRVDSGFSLIELTIAVTILGLVMAAVTSTLLISLRATSEATDRLDRGNDVLLTSALFGPDVAGATTVTAPMQSGHRGPPATAGCGRNDPLVVEFRGLTPEDLRTDRSWTVSYVLTDAGTALARRSCTGTSTSPDSELVVSRGLAATTPASVSCSTGPDTPTDCEQPDVRTVSLRLTSTDGVRRTTTGTRRTT